MLLLLASFDVVLPSEHEKPSWIWITWRIKISQCTACTRWVLLSRPPARRSCFALFSSEPSSNLLCATILESWHQIDQLCICALTSARAFAAAAYCPRPRARRSAGPSSFWRRSSQLVSLCAADCSYLASHRMALTRERKNPSQIAREIEIFSLANFAWSVWYLQIFPSNWQDLSRVSI